MIIPHYLFWISTFLSMTLLLILYKTKIIDKKNVRHYLRCVNGFLFLLLPILIFLHIFEIYCDKPINIYFKIVESILFPIYILVLFTHIYLNKEYFTND